MASNLPPGVTDSMLPGNTAEDVALDKLADALGAILTTQLGEDEFDSLCNFVFQEIEGAHSSGFRDGYREGQANASRIATPPELFEACKFLLFASDCDGSNLALLALQEAQNEARAALAKAAGSPHGA